MSNNFESEQQELQFYRTLFSAMYSTIKNDEENIFSSLKSGTNGYHLKIDDPNLLYSILTNIRKGKSVRKALLSKSCIDSYLADKAVPNHKQDRTVNLPLTSRELEILQLLSEGLLYKEIAVQLGITLGTVKQHIHRIYNKLDVNNRTEAINIYKQ